MEKTSGKNKKLYLIGIDAAPLWMIQHFIKKFRMKGFEIFKNNGVLTKFLSTLPPMTGTACPSIYTGLEPGEHGSLDFFYMDKDYTKQLIYFDAEKTVPFWDFLAKKGIASLVITPAMVIKLSNQKNVDMITGFPLPPKFSSPKIQNLAKKFHFTGEPDIEKEIKTGAMTLKQASQEYVKSISARAELSKYLIKNNNYQLSFIYFAETDRMQHFALNKTKWEESVAPLYKEISDFIEWLIDFSKNNNEDAVIMLISDHGAQPIYNKFLLNSWLINNHYAALKTGVIKNIESDKENKLETAKYKLREQLLKSGARRLYDKMPKNTKKIISNLIGKILSGSTTGEFTRIHDFDFDMKNTRAFASVSNFPVSVIWINDKRFRTPTIKTESEKQKIKKEIINNLSKLRTNNGKKLITDIVDGDKYYKKTNLFISPDIIISALDNYTIDIFNFSKNNIFMKPEAAKSGDHTLYGIFGLINNSSAGNIKKINIKKISVCDIFDIVVNYFR
ncbi:MAG: alkaline phosphatase family protein [Candidatus Marsarchaeota archaeon]|nr:alkaline phosphatase family protein [Candidatus Marsarchaeota archaeon]MCL5094549.1 alkaline phosphatase family protein [Candidatus Marsarchaeota archaeon]